jgi:thiamine kinase-like enzyme
MEDHTEGLNMEGYVVMEYVLGTCLGKGVWRELSPTTKAAVYDQLISYIQQLRAFSLPRNSRLGRIGGGVSVGSVFAHCGSDPFDPLAAFVRYFNLKLELMRRCSRAQGSDFTEEEFSPLAFIPGDIAEKNLILDPAGTLWFRDWAMAGVYPVFFEWAAMQRQEWIERFMDGLKARLVERGFCDYEMDAEKVKRFKTLSWCLDFPVFDGVRRRRRYHRGHILRAPR